MSGFASTKDLADKNISFDELDGHRDFPVRNLPFGVSSPLAGAPRGGIAIGDHILDLRALHDAGLLDDEA